MRIPLLVLVLGLPLLAQPLRYEVARRRMALEESFAQAGVAAVNDEALRQLGIARSDLVRFRLASACEALDRARLAISGADRASEDRLYVASLAIVPERRLIDSSAPRLRVRLQRLYRRDVRIPGGLRCGIELVMTGSEGERRLAQVTGGVSPRSFVLELPGGVTGDAVLRTSFRRGTVRVAVVEQTISLVRDLPRRLAALRRGLAAARSRGSALGRATLASWIDRLDHLVRRPALERDVAAAALLDRAEDALRGLGRRPLPRPLADGELDVAVPGRRGVIPCRLLIPPEVRTDPVPLMVALHGEAGDEALFFDSYGRGALAAGCRERGWALIAPNGWAFEPADLKALVDAVDAWQPIDRSRIIVVGVSVGATRALALGRDPSAGVRAVAAISQADTGAVLGNLLSLPVFLAAGREDPSAARVDRFAQDLRRAGHSKLRVERLAGVERVLVPAAAWPALFDWLDQQH